MTIRLTESDRAMIAELRARHGLCSDAATVRFGLQMARIIDRARIGVDALGPEAPMPPRSP